MKLYLLVILFALAAARPDVSHLLNAQQHGYDYPKPIAPFPPVTDQQPNPTIGSTVTTKPYISTTTVRPTQYPVTTIKPLSTGYEYNKPSVSFGLPSFSQQYDSSVSSQVAPVTQRPFSGASQFVTQGPISTFQQVTQKPVSTAQQTYTQNAANFQQQVNQVQPISTAQQFTQQPFTTAQQVFSQNTVNIPQQVSTNRPISTAQQVTQRPITTSQQVFSQNTVNIPQQVSTNRPVSIIQQDTQGPYSTFQQISTNRPISNSQQVTQRPITTVQQVYTQNAVSIPQQVTQRPITVQQQTSPQVFPSSQSTTIKPVNEYSEYDHVNYDEASPSVSPTVTAGPTLPSFIPSFSGVSSIAPTASSFITSFVPNVISQSSQFFPSSQSTTQNPITAQDEVQSPTFPAIPSFSTPSFSGLPTNAQSGVSFLTSLIPNVASQSVSQFFPSSTTQSPNTANQFVAQDEIQPSVSASLPSFSGIPTITGIPEVTPAAFFSSFLPNIGSQSPPASGSTTTSGATSSTPSIGLSSLSSFVPSFLNQGSSTAAPTAPAAPAFPSFSQNGLFGTLTSFLPNQAPSSPTTTTTTGTNAVSSSKTGYDIPNNQYNVPNLVTTPETIAAISLLSQTLPSIIAQTVKETHRQIAEHNHKHNGAHFIDPTFSSNVQTKQSYTTTNVPSYTTNLVTSSPTSFSTTHSQGTPSYGRLETVQPNQYYQESTSQTKANDFLQDVSVLVNEINNEYFPSTTQRPISSTNIPFDQYPSSTIRNTNEYIVPFSSSSSTQRPSSVIVPSHTLNEHGYHYNIPKIGFGFK